MKRVFSIMLAALMLASVVTVMPVSAAEAAPSGQIWEGETELRQIYISDPQVTGSVTDFYLQAITESKYGGASFEAHSIIKASAGASISFKLDVKCSGEKTFIFRYLKSQDFAIFDVYWDGTPIATGIDSYAASNARVFVEEDLGKFDVTAGEHTLKIVVTGKNASATAYNMSIDCFEMVGEDGVRRTQMYGSYSENYKKKYVLEDGTIRLEGEGMLADVVTAKTTITTQAVQIWGSKKCVFSCGSHLFANKLTGSGNEKITLKFRVDQSGKYDITYRSGTGPDYAAIQWDIDGVEMGRIDMYSNPAANAEQTKRGVDLLAGEHELTITCIGRNVAVTAAKFVISLDHLDLKRTGDIEYSAVNASLGDSIKVNYYADDIGYADPKTTFTMNGKSVTVDGKLTDDGKQYKFTFEGVAPQCLGDKITAVLKDGDTVIGSKEYSVVEYLTKLKADNASDAKLMALVNDLLVYGGAAQAYKGQTNTLGNGVAGSTYEAPVAAAYKLNDSKITWKTATVLFDSVNKIKITFAAESIDGLTFTCNDAEITPVSNGDGTYTVITDAISAVELDKVFRIMTSSEDPEAANISYSVATYVLAKDDGDTAMANLVKALYNYGCSAKAYADAQ